MAHIRKIKPAVIPPTESQTNTTYPVLFGTDGIRTRMGTEPLTPTCMMSLGDALGLWITTYQHDHTHITPKRILIGHDTRISCHLLKSALKTGLLLHNSTLYDLGVISTPALYFLTTNATHTTQDQFDMGIMITASHNHASDNGIKIFTHDQGKITSKDEQLITQLYYDILSNKLSCARTRDNDYTQLGTEQHTPELIKKYTQDLVAKLNPAMFNLSGTITIALDCAHGSYYALAPHVFETMGIQVHTSAHSPTGTNINHESGSEHPEHLQNILKQNPAITLGFAFDGDGDRVIVVTKEGKIKTGDDILAFLLTHPAYAHENTIVGTVMTNQGLENYLHTKHKKLIRTPVGDKHIINFMREKKLLLGGEPSGHIILGDFNQTSDALFVALRVLETAFLTNNWELTTFTKFPQIIINTPVPNKKDLSTEPFAQTIQNARDLLPHGRLIARYSGTEPVLRIMVENNCEEKARKIANTLAQKLLKLLTSPL